MSRPDFTIPLHQLTQAQAAAEEISNLTAVPSATEWLAIRLRLAKVGGGLSYWTERITRTVNVEVTDREAA